MPPQDIRQHAAWIAIVLTLVVTLLLDAITPLGYAEWCMYFVAVALAFFQERPRGPLLVAAIATVLLALGSWLSPDGIDPFMANLNRAIGAGCCWVLAWVVRDALLARVQVSEALWLEESLAELMVSLRGSQSPEALAHNALSVLGDRLGAPVGALYQSNDSELTLVGGLAMPPNQPRSLRHGDGAVAETVRSGRAQRIAPVQASHLVLATSLGTSTPGELLLAPITLDGEVIGAFEMGRMGKPPISSRLELKLIRAAGEPIGVALRAANVRQQLLDLLEETQRQSAELQTQQEELQVANEELEEQSNSLQQSQAILEAQQAELERTNVRLEERTHQLESQRRSLLAVQADLERNAHALAEASRYKSEFLANMSHELRTPLNSALILAKLLADNKPGTLTEEQVRYAHAIHAANNDLLVLINDILDLSRIEAGYVELAADPLDLRWVATRLHDIFQPLAADKGLALRIEGDFDAIGVGDVKRLKQILKNLLANAIKFTEQGEVTLRMEARQGDRLAFVVTDTGIGIPADQHEAIFEAFRQADGSTSRRFGGTGLGLSISRDLARRMGGTLQVRSTPGEGSCFTLELPADMSAAALASAMPEPAPAPAAARALVQPPPDGPVAEQHAPPAMGLVPDDRACPARPGRLVLVVEDEPAFAAAMVDIAHDLDFDCVVAASAAEAIALAAELAPCGILLDIGLPDGSGLGVLERLKRDPTTRHIPVHVVSALDRTQLALEMGAVGYLCKPATREMLGGALRALESRSRRDGQRLLIVEDDPDLRASLRALLARDGLSIVAVGSVDEAQQALAGAPFDCVVTDLALTDGSGDALLEQIARGHGASAPPVIVYTGRSLGREQEQRLRRYSSSIIIKGARSPERLLDEVTLFLHSVEAQLPGDQQRLLAEARRRDSALDGRSVLLVEDDVRNIFALSSVLEPMGVRLEIARNGREALEVLEQRSFDLVLMDIMMPEMDGLEAMRRIRAQPRLAELPIIALTAKVMRDDRQRCFDAGANDYIAKPIDVDKLVSLCRVWCSRP
ncbi:response regulator [Thermomonas sp.]|jgi:signal transduction histidine kinase/DNA-binding response OmpR family regulator|uniref:hybrid sensor histidine kinase/response regulator n=1 Tax=Thermomonas sp. TaxID=1971895 RepID=UPI002579C9B0|nr:response regulator [Thermomonas sp.]